MKKSTEFMKVYTELGNLYEAYKTNRGTESERSEQAVQIVCDLAKTPEIRRLPRAGQGIIVLKEDEWMGYTSGVYLTGDGLIIASAHRDCEGSHGTIDATIDAVEPGRFKHLFKGEDGAERVKELKRTLDRKF